MCSPGRLVDEHVAAIGRKQRSVGPIPLAAHQERVGILRKDGGEAARTRRARRCQPLPSAGRRARPRSSAVRSTPTYARSAALSDEHVALSLGELASTQRQHPRQ
jgi:hypothetical protein